MAELAQRAGVGVGTLYRHFPTREALLGAVTQRSLGLVLQRARAAAAIEGPAIEALRWFLHETIHHRDQLALPLHGVPAVADPVTRRLRHEIRAALQEILTRGREDGSVLADVTPGDLIITGAQLAQPLAQVTDWDRVARRQAAIYLAGLRARP